MERVKVSATSGSPSERYRKLARARRDLYVRDLLLINPDDPHQETQEDSSSVFCELSTF